MKITKSLFKLYRNTMFMLPAETAHSISLASAEFLYKSWIKNLFITNKVNTSNKLMGLNFPNKLGLAAGFDKNGDYLNFDNNIGLGFIVLVALQLIIGGLNDYGVLSINETFKKYF